MAEPLWTSSEIAAATGGVALGAAFACDGVSIDTRGLEPGDLFVALAGARDGHEFIDAALSRGAAGALTSREVEWPHVLVDDTLIALERLGVAARQRSSALRGAVTGSVGKTSVTQAIQAGLALAGRAHASVKSYNNHIGVPLTLARMPRATQRAVFEIGMNHAGEIAPLAAMVAPQAVAVTMVGPVHIENFSDGETGVAKAKAEIFTGLQPGGVAVLNADDRWFDFLADQARASGARVVSFGAAEGSDARLTGFEPDADGARVSAVMHGEPLSYSLAQSGCHGGPNSLCALLMLEALDTPRAVALEALAGFAPLSGRGAEAVIHAPMGDFILIDESYNANPVSMAAALRSLGARPASGRRIAVLTDMLELGGEEAGYHAALVEPIAAAGVDLVFCAGPLMAALWEKLPSTRRGGYAPDAATLAGELAGALRAGDLVMVKGSNGSKAGAIVAALTALGGGRQVGG
ncbi:MAG: UDP-N-acetylmuramoylalanyl-D-glutamyl-2,6-diaminopimelate--D-alanyl-D-alanyl ligase [Caulobacteraceae bacterium]|nr:UDP-N-acetylmuramoylalanyl-D-glutamyl-2,6-diaminopimelate--D-alanyl-D-alanyl ligase [Caulobacteraceae bacterium]